MKRTSWPILAAAVVLMATVAGGYDGNDKDKNAANKPNKSARESSKVEVTSEMEAAATNFVREHHPELLEILTQLKGANTTQYHQAIRDLSRAATTLATTEKSDPKKYLLDLRAWQVNSEVQVLTARLIMGRTPELEEKLKAKLREQIDIRLDQQKLDRERTEARLKRLNESIAKLEESRDQEVAKAFDKLTKTTTKPQPKKETRTTASPKKGETKKPKKAL